MEYVFCCPKCGATYSMPTPDSVKTCSDCNIPPVYVGYTEEKWSKLSLKERTEIKKSFNTFEKDAEEKRLRAMKLEQEKQAFARSFNDFYEYEVVTILNENHGRIDKEKMMAILSAHAREGWKLHSIYSN